MPVKVKICGIKTIDAALAALDSGADFLGFNFVPASKRYIAPEDAKIIIDKIRPPSRDLKIIGVFQNASPEEINKISRNLNLDGVQLHGEQAPEYCKNIDANIIIKALNLPSDFDVEEIKQKMSKYNVQYFLVDREIQGEGRHLNMQKVKTLAQTFPLFVSGGLNPSIVTQIIKTTRPFGVDVAGGVETNGQKDDQKIENFIKNAKGVNL